MFSLFPVSPRWFVFSLDLFFCLGSWVFVLVNWFFFLNKNAGFDYVSLTLLPVLIVFPILFYWFNLYSGIIRFTGFYEVKRIFLISSIGSLLVYILNVNFLYNEGASSYILYVYDMTGRLVKTIVRRGNIGQDEFVVQHLQAGAEFNYELFNGQNNYTGKLISVQQE